MRGARDQRGIPEPVLLRIAELIEEQSGLALDDLQCRALDAAVVERMAALNMGEPWDYLALLRQVRSGELRVLIERIANGETAFFRNAPHFRALRDVVLPVLLTVARRVVFWSAGCATGEEAYSLAIACLEAGLPAVAPVMVLGTDINRSALAAAERGEYAGRHLANVGPELRERYFEPTPRGWRVNDTVRALVSWAPHNLLNTELPVPPESVDLLFCQNVTIYFRPETIRRVTERLATVLRPGGHFFPGFSEMPWCRAPGLELVSFGDCFAYRKQLPRSSGSVQDRPMKRRLAGGRALNAGEGSLQGSRRARLPQSVPEVPTAAAAESAHPAGSGSLESARQAASRGDLARALQEVSAALEADPMRPEAWELFGLLQRQAGRRDEAERGFRRQLYLAPESPLPHFHLATLFRERGQTNDARREYARAARILETLSPETQLAGVTADLLLRACRRFGLAGDTESESEGPS
ncbi:MAG TPA: CheR family methyltransferase [Armatimonadota bacterium]|nr:methyltransferase domain-containing protein [Armatimonadota bacterium]HOJ21713.1 CheR family methyltransferase [Armatimonadota bacterium]HOM80643.1 CheR family methyltransferase [Armatimonadota bacterium]HPO72161.1 CheR family methyltransferase [Armatimonadota bacterium]HPT98595.1 CheR family methyltransferase [Armatimonadota bacterium]